MTSHLTWSSPTRPGEERGLGVRQAIPGRDPVFDALFRAGHADRGASRAEDLLAEQHLLAEAWDDLGEWLVLDDGEPMENVPPALELEGHTVQSRERTPTGWRLTVRRGEE